MSKSKGRDPMWQTPPKSGRKWSGFWLSCVASMPVKGPNLWRDKQLGIDSRFWRTEGDRNLVTRRKPWFLQELAERTEGRFRAVSYVSKVYKSDAFLYHFIFAGVVHFPVCWAFGDKRNCAFPVQFMCRFWIDWGLIRFLRTGQKWCRNGYDPNVECGVRSAQARGDGARRSPDGRV